MTIGYNWDTTTGRMLLKTLVRKVFNADRPDAIVQWKELCNDIKTNDEYEKDVRWAGIGQMSEIEDGEAIGLQDPVLDTTREYRQSRFGTGFKITSGMKAFEKHGLVKKFSSDLKKVMLEGKDLEIAKMFNNATATTYSAGYDTLALASAAHTCLDDASTTYSNYLNSALGHTSLETARLAFRKMVNDQGQKIVVKPTKLVVCPDYMFTAEELLGSTGQVETADNTKNVHKGIMPYMVYDRFTSTTAWAMIAKDSEYDLNVFTFKEPDLVTQDAPDTSRSIIVTSEQWFKYGHGDPRRFYLGDA